MTNQFNAAVNELIRASPAYGDDLTAHYTNFGHSMQPRCADASGYLHYRENFQTDIPESNWTEAERYIDEAESAIAQWRSR